MTFGYNDQSTGYKAGTENQEIVLLENGGFFLVSASDGSDVVVQAKDDAGNFKDIHTIISGETKTMSPAPRGTYKMTGGNFTYAIGG